MKVRYFDSTLRDGLHAVKQKANRKQIEDYCEVIDNAGMATSIIGHGNGIGASSIQMGLCETDEIEMLRIAKQKLKKTPLGTFVTVGFGTIDNEIKKALQVGTSIFCIASHCTEANTMQKHINFLAERGKECYGVLMNIHLSSPEAILSQCKLIQDYGADGVILMDSAGASTTSQVENLISTVANKVKIDVGFHPHNNLGIAVANAFVAIQNGASIIDGTIGGFGSGAGNCQLEALEALLRKSGYEPNADLYSMLDASEVIKRDFEYNKMIDAISVVSGYAGVVSTFKTKVLEFSEQYNIDSRDVFMELGKRKAISGQDDLILESILYLKENAK